MATNCAGARVRSHNGRVPTSDVSAWIQETVADMISENGDAVEHSKSCADEIKMAADRMLQTSSVDGAIYRSGLIKLQTVKHFGFGLAIYREHLGTGSQIWNITICSVSTDRLDSGRVESMFAKLMDEAATPNVLSTTVVAEPHLSGKPEFHAVLLGHSEPRFKQDVTKMASTLRSCGYRVNAIPGSTPEQALSALEKLSVEAKENRCCPCVHI